MEKIHEGWLTKSPPEWRMHGAWKLFKSKWRQRYFVLYSPPSNCVMPGTCSALLCYYDNETLSREYGRVDLGNCEEILTKLESDDFKHVFAIKTSYKDRNRTYYLAAETEEGMEEWTSCLCFVLRLSGGETSLGFGNEASTGKDKFYSSFSLNRRRPTAWASSQKAGSGTHLRRASTSLTKSKSTNALNVRPVESKPKDENTILPKSPSDGKMAKKNNILSTVINRTMRRPSCPALQISPPSPCVQPSPILNTPDTERRLPWTPTSRETSPAPYTPSMPQGYSPAAHLLVYATDDPPPTPPRRIGASMPNVLVNCSYDSNRLSSNSPDENEELLDSDEEGTKDPDYDMPQCWNLGGGKSGEEAESRGYPMFETDPSREEVVLSIVNEADYENYDYLPSHRNSNVEMKSDVENGEGIFEDNYDYLPSRSCEESGSYQNRPYSGVEEEGSFDDNYDHLPCQMMGSITDDRRTRKEAAPNPEEELGEFEDNYDHLPCQRNGNDEQVYQNKATLNSEEDLGIFEDNYDHLPCQRDSQSDNILNNGSKADEEIGTFEDNYDHLPCQRDSLTKSDNHPESNLEEYIGTFEDNYDHLPCQKVTPVKDFPNKIGSSVDNSKFDDSYYRKPCQRNNSRAAENRLGSDTVFENDRNPSNLKENIPMVNGKESEKQVSSPIGSNVVQAVAKRSQSSEYYNSNVFSTEIQTDSKEAIKSRGTLTDSCYILPNVYALDQQSNTRTRVSVSGNDTGDRDSVYHSMNGYEKLKEGIGGFDSQMSRSKSETSPIDSRNMRKTAGKRCTNEDLRKSSGSDSCDSSHSGDSCDKAEDDAGGEYVKLAMGTPPIRMTHKTRSFKRQTSSKCKDQEMYVNSEWAVDQVHESVRTRIVHADQKENQNPNDAISDSLRRESRPPPPAVPYKSPNLKYIYLEKQQFDRDSILGKAAAPLPSTSGGSGAVEDSVEYTIIDEDKTRAFLLCRKASEERAANLQN